MFPSRLTSGFRSALKCNFSTVPVIKGKATTQATLDFITKSKFKLFHKFNESGLYVGPVIHDSPRHYSIDDNVYLDALTKRAVLINRSNCLVVYDHKRGKPWSLTNLSAIITPENGVKRENIVAMANLGLASTTLDMYKRLSEAIKSTGLQQIDMAFFEINDDTVKNKSKYIRESTEALQELVMNGSLQSYGIKVSVNPFIQHSPPAVSSYGDCNVIPVFIEESIRSKDNRSPADFVLYTISPTIASPATYPFLSNSDNDEENRDEYTRTFARIACDPLICIRGKGKVDRTQDELIEMAKNPPDLEEEPLDFQREVHLISDVLPKYVENSISQALDHLCPPLKSTPKLQDKALRAVFSVGIDLAMVDTEISALMGKVNIGQDDMISPADSDGVFGAFALPEGLIRREPKE